MLFLAAPTQAQMPSASNGQNAEAKEAAKEAASQWLELTDAGEFGKSYDEASTMMQNQVKRDEWITQGEQVKAQNVTDPSSRELVVARYRETLPEADGGPFVLMQYRSEFEPGTFNEIVLARKEEGDWKIAGYQVRPMQRMQQGAPGQGGPGNAGGQGGNGQGGNGQGGNGQGGGGR